MQLTVEFMREEDGRWIAVVSGIPKLQGISVYGNTRDEAMLNVQKAAFQSLVWAIDDGDITTCLDNVTFSVISEAVAA